MYILVSIFLYIINLFTKINFYQWICLFLAIAIVYSYNFYKNNLWKKLGVPYLTPLPLVGNDLDLALGLKTFQALQQIKYNKFGDVKFGGLYAMSSPVFFIKDTGLIETVLIKDFSHFTDRGIPFNEKKDPLSAHLFNLTGKRWKGLRNKLSPVFTSGKLKTMHQQLIDCADILAEVLETSSKTGESVDFKETMAKFTTDVIGSCAYGLNMNSLRDPDNEFRKMGRSVFKTSVRRKILNVLRLMLRSIHPSLSYFFKLTAFPAEVTAFFMNLVHSTIREREKNPEYKRNDFIQLIMNLRHQENSGTNGKLATNEEESGPRNEVYLDDNMMAANSFLFFVAGFETTASTLSYCLFELSKHPDIQEKLHLEIKDVLSKHEGQASYEAIKNLPFMDMVVSETLRKYPPLPLLMRVSTENFRVPDTDLVIPKGVRIEIPVYSLHHDHSIFPNPEQFKPERFSQDMGDSIPKGAYLPFGDGPRICIGARFAQMEIKVCLCKILSKFRVAKHPTMSDTIDFDPKATILLVPKGGIMLNVSKR